MLSDHERRVLEELERGLETGPRGTGASRVEARRSPGRTVRPPGTWPVVLLGCVSVTLLFLGVAAAALALATATAIGWLYWRLWSLERHGDPTTGSAMTGIADRRSGREPRLGESIRRYLRWLSEAE